MQLTERQRKHLRRLAHHMKPVVQVGNSGLTDSLVAELNSCLTRHELIKIKDFIWIVKYFYMDNIQCSNMITNSKLHLSAHINLKLLFYLRKIKKFPGP